MKKQPKPEHFCNTCTNHYDEHNQGVNGFVLCRCIFSDFDKLLNADTCENHTKIMKLQK